MGVFAFFAHGKDSCLSWIVKPDCSMCGGLILSKVNRLGRKPSFFKIIFLWYFCEGTNLSVVKMSNGGNGRYFNCDLVFKDQVQHVFCFWTFGSFDFGCMRWFGQIYRFTFGRFTWYCPFTFWELELIGWEGWFIFCTFLNFICTFPTRGLISCRKLFIC